MIKPITERQQTLIVNNVLKAIKDINLLNKTGYNYLYLCSGFIAHYNQYGFINHYKNHSLLNDIVKNYNANKWLNFTPSDQNYDYYMSKAKIYKTIMEKLNVK